MQPQTTSSGWDVAFWIIIGCGALICLAFTLAFGIMLATAASAAESCIASVYGTHDSDQNGTTTASGIRLNDNGPPTIAHKSRPLRSFVVVTNRKTGRSVRAQITDRGPYVRGRCVDLNHSAARAIGCSGLCSVDVEPAS